MNYQQANVAGQAWVRCSHVTLDNPLNAPRSARFAEERVVTIGGDEVIKPLGTLTEYLVTASAPATPTTPAVQANAGEQFNLLDPETGAVIGSATYAQFYAMAASLYLHVAAKRDAAAAPV